MATLEVGGYDAPVLLLACGVPYIEFCLPASQFDALDLEVNGHGGSPGQVGEVVLNVPPK
jgi:hypothetical protein